MMSTRTFFLAGLLFLVPSSSWGQAWYEFYEQAQSALDRADQASARGDTPAALTLYQEAGSLLQKTIERFPIPELKKRTYGVAYYEDYLPHYSLGRAYEGQREWEKALRQYSISREYGAISGRPALVADLEYRYQSILRRLGRLPEPTSSLPRLAPSPTQKPTTSPTATTLPSPSRTPSPQPTPTWTRTPKPRPTRSNPITATATSVPGSPTSTPTESPGLPATLPTTAQDSNPEEPPTQTPSPSALSLVAPTTPNPRKAMRSLPPLVIPITLTFLALGLTGWIILLFRRRKSRSAGFNPYVAGAPILDEQMFFGRRKLLDSVLASIHHNSILLYGERRIGKTSLLHQIHRHLRSHPDTTIDYYPVLIDLEGTHEDEFFRLLISEISSQLGGRMEVPSLRFTPRQDTGHSYGGADFVHDLRVILRALREHSRGTPKLVLLLDEVDVLNTFSARTNQRLRSLFMKTFARNLGMVMAGVGISKKWDSEGSPWYNFFEEIPVAPLEIEEARALILKPVQGVYQFSPAVVDRILESTQGRPYWIQKLCISCVRHVRAQGRWKIRMEDLNEVQPRVLAGVRL